MNDILNKANELIEEAKALQAPVLNIIETDTIKAKYAQMPVTRLSLDFMVQVMEPVPMIPHIVSVTVGAHLMGDGIKGLEEVLLAEWKKQFTGIEAEQLAKLTAAAPWVLNVNKVELIECDLLVPKKS